ncbi:hypothetical protein [Botrimarina hoheduenensis]|uniref:PEP-CTERM protein-sorting domain-containing protein n=1 Tax=Botrimarina hoheduenensis TaxID=2528000 RepID=A0A5C5VRT7_9BACT|nr:hypothetical protein [Botrimarina hoheduenensis]TWT40635.1 hypothetical protein Pla111_32800 [Botrimarina hoheduenensis]
MRRYGPLFLSLLVLGISAPVAPGAVIYETDYTLRSDNGNPFIDGGELRFQDGWLGQTGYTVDSDAPGTVTSSGTFLRTLNNRGATGGVAGGDGSGEVGAGFNDGDTIRIVTSLQYELAPGTTTPSAPNQELANIGIRSNFVNGGFNAAPTHGFEVAYNSFGDGSLKVFTNFARAGSVGADNAFALFVDAADGGFNSGENGGDADLSTDNLEFDYTAEFQAGAWAATELIVTNLDTNMVVAQASIDKPAALEAVAYTGTEAFFGQRFLGNASGAVGTSDGMRFEFTAAIPEPTSFALVWLLSLGVAARRRS